MANLTENLKSVNSALSMLASTVFTSIIYDLLSASTFKVTSDLEGGWTVEEVSQLSTLAQLLIIIFTFVIGYFLINYVLLRIISMIQSRTYLRIPALTRNEIVKRYDQIGKMLVNISQQLENASSEVSSIYLDDVANCVIQLNKLFCSTNQVQQTAIKNSFRKETSIMDFKNLISVYEFEKRMELLKKLVEKVYSEFKDVSSAEQDKTSLLNNISKTICTVKTLIVQAAH